MIYVIRHAEPEMAGVFLGSSDPGLTENGRKQAETLSRIHVAVVYTSPKRRAKETSVYVSAPQTVVLSGLQELHFGQWEGKKWSEIERQWPQEAQAKLLNWFGTTPPGGEDFDVFVGRVHRAWEQIIKGPRPAAVVAHLVVNAVITNRMTGRDPTEYTQTYAEVVTYDI